MLLSLSHIVRVYKLTLRHCFHRELKSSTIRTILSVTMDYSRTLMFNLPER